MAKNKDSPIMTPKPGHTLGWRGRRFRHGDQLPSARVEYFNSDSMIKWNPPKFTMKKGMFKTVRDFEDINGKKIKGRQYAPGDKIEQDHLPKIQPIFLEPLEEPEEIQGKKQKQKQEDESLVA